MAFWLRLCTPRMAILWSFISFCLYSIPGNELPEVGIIQFDKFIHITLFAIWAFLWRGAFSQTMTTVFMLGTAYGLAIEVWQRWGLRFLGIGMRGFDWWDVVADAIGCLLGVWIWLQFKGRTQA